MTKIQNSKLTLRKRVMMRGQTRELPAKQELPSPKPEGTSWAPSLRSGRPDGRFRISSPTGSGIGFRIFERGYAALTTVLLTVIVSLTIVGGFSFFTFQEVGVNRAFTKSIESRYISEGGVEDGVYRIVTGKQIADSETLAVGKGTTTIIVTRSGNRRTIRSEGTREKTQQNLETNIEVRVQETNFFYGAQVGEGGLEMESNSSVVGSVYVNGNITGSTGATITGDAIAAGTSTIQDMVINGNAHANFIDDTIIGGYASSTTELDDVIVGKDAHAQELDDTTVTRDAYYMVADAQSTVLGQRYPGNPGPPNLDPLPMPISDSAVTQWKNDAQTIGTIATGTCSQEWSPPTSPYIVNGGILEKSLRLDNNQILIMKGTVWVKCNVTIDNGATIQLDPSYGEMSGVLLSDGWMHLKNNGLFQGSGTPGSYLMLLATATGGGHHGSAIDLHNNATGAIFYATQGMIFLHNNVLVTELVGQKLHLENNAELIYEIGLQNVKFSAGPTSGYDVKYWKEVE